MTKKVIDVEKISKKYVIYHEQRAAYNTLIDTFSRTSRKWAKKIFLPWKMGSTSSSSIEEFWALRNVNFEIEEGDRIGILGKNGAGKSTLLKILARITEPTEGRIKIKGRVASLLEVGTGFHPELSGRENIYLNGAILGMSLREIKQKFDQIVAFADVEKFLDVPIKRFSSGMYTRLAFAIGAHLDPDVLIVDEVLAVGDAQFQEKCLNKMKSMQNEGRTILFVSHSASAISSICNKGIVLDHGHVKAFGPIDECLSYYVNSYEQGALSWEGDLGDEHLRLYRVALNADNPKKEFFYQGEEMTLHIDYELLQEYRDLIIGVRVWNRQNQVLARAHTWDDDHNFQKCYQKGRHRLSLSWNAGLFHEGEYTLKLECFIHQIKSIFSDQIILKFPVYPPKKNTRFDHGLGPGKESIFLANQWKLETRPTTVKQNP